jgi:diguanylate cyclase (GGDEF)-like protein/PAS domain S-box-containing protein
MKPATPLRQIDSELPSTLKSEPFPRHTAPKPLKSASPAAGAPAPIRRTAARWEVALFAATTVALLAYLAWACGAALGIWSAAHRVPIVTQSLLVLLSASAAALAIGASRRPDVGTATHRAWLFFAAAQAATGIVSVSWVFRMAVGSVAAGSLPLQVIAGAYDVFLLCALLTFPVKRLQAADRATFWFDSAIVAGVAAVLMWHLLWRTALIAAGSDWRTSIYALAYPVADIVILFAIIVLLLRRPVAGSVRAIRILFCSVLLNTAADVLFMWSYIAHEPQGTRFFYLAWAVVAWMAAAAAYSQGKNVLVGLFSTDSGVRERRGRAPSLIPYIAILAIYATLLLEVVRTETRELATGIQGSQNTLPIAEYPITALVIGAIIVTAIVVARQVAAQRKNALLAAERLAREAHFRALVQHSSDMVVVLDAAGFVREASPAVERVLGHAPESVVGRPFYDFFVADDMASVQADIAQAVAAGSGDAASGGAVEWRVRDANGGERWVEAICTNLLSDPVVAGIVINGRDVSERKQLEVELTHRAYHDPLTGLVNASRFRAKITDAIAHAWSGSRPGDGRSGLAILYIDLDGFKAVNDIHGHDAGDFVLAAVSDRLRDATRGSDTAARLGGDEFAILLERLRDENEVRMVAERVLHLVRRPVSIEHMDVTVEASIGIVCAALGAKSVDDAGTLDADSLLRQADSAMYSAKARGRGQYEFYTPSPSPAPDAVG